MSDPSSCPVPGDRSFSYELIDLEAGLGTYQKHGTAIPDETLNELKKCQYDVPFSFATVAHPVANKAHTVAPFPPVVLPLQDSVVFAVLHPARLQGISFYPLGVHCSVPRQHQALLRLDTYLR